MRPENNKLSYTQNEACNTFFFGKKYLTVSDKIFLSGRQKIPVMSGFVMTNGNTNLDAHVLHLAVTLSAN
jgi:hypothetical protein